MVRRGPVLTAAQEAAVVDRACRRYNAPRDQVLSVYRNARAVAARRDIARYLRREGYPLEAIATLLHYQTHGAVERLLKGELWIRSH